MTWGASKGQLGYAVSGIQVLPRKVAVVPAPITQIVATEFATVCLLESAEVFVCFRNAYFKMVFPISRFATEMSVYRPPTATPRPSICRISGNGSEFLAVSAIGDVFNFTLDDTVIDTAAASRSPTRLWDLRKSPSGVVDAAIGPEAAILCTRSGHVFIKQRKADSNTKAADNRSNIIGLGNNTTSAGSGGRRNYKFKRVPFLQRITKVTTNAFGAFAAIRSDVALLPVSTAGFSLAGDLLSVLPHWQRCCSSAFVEECPTLPAAYTQSVVKEELEDVEEQHIVRDLEETIRLSKAAADWDETWSSLDFGTDLYIEAQRKRIPVHSSIIAARSPIVNNILRIKRSSDVTGVEYLAEKTPVLILRKCTTFTALLLTHYLYSDSFACVWDSRIAMGHAIASFDRLAFGAIKEELQRLAHILHLPELGRVCGRSEKLLCSPTLSINIVALQHGQTCAAPDVLLQLADTAISCHSIILRSRCPFFAALFDDEEWLAERKQKNSAQIEIDLAHIPLEVFKPIINHIYSDTDILFESTGEHSVQILIVAS